MEIFEPNSEYKKLSSQYEGHGPVDRLDYSRGHAAPHISFGSTLKKVQTDMFNEKATSVPSLDVALNGLMERNKLITSSIANVSTPGYKKQSIDFETDLRKAQGLTNEIQMPLQKTDGQHINFETQEISDLHSEIMTDLESELHSDGNNIDIDSEMVSLAKTGMKFRAISDLAQRQFSGLRSVIRGQ